MYMNVCLHTCIYAYKIQLKYNINVYIYLCQEYIEIWIHCEQYEYEGDVKYDSQVSGLST